MKGKSDMGVRLASVCTERQQGDKTGRRSAVGGNSPRQHDLDRVAGRSAAWLQAPRVFLSRTPLKRRTPLFRP